MKNRHKQRITTWVSTAIIQQSVAQKVPYIKCILQSRHQKKPHSFTSPIYHYWTQAQVLTSLCMKVQSCSAPLVELCAFPSSPQIPHQLWLGQWMAGWCQQTPEDFVRSGKSLWPESGVCSKQSHQAAGKAFLCSHQIAFDLKKINNSPVKESLQSAPNILTSIFFLLVCFLMKWLLIVPVV